MALASGFSSTGARFHALTDISFGAMGKKLRTVIAMMSFTTRFGKIKRFRLMCEIRFARSTPWSSASLSSICSSSDFLSSPNEATQWAIGRPHGDGYSMTACPFPSDLAWPPSEGSESRSKEAQPEPARKRM